MNNDTNPLGDAPQNAPAPDGSQSAAANNQQPASGAPKKKSKPNLILWLSVGGGVLLLGIITTVLILLLGGGVSKEDFAKAQNKVDGMISSYNKISTSYISTNSTESDTKNTLEKIKTYRQEFNASYIELGESRAIEKDEQAGELFQKLSDRKPKFDQAIDAMVEVYEEVMPAVSTISNSYSATNYSDRIAEFEKALNSIGELKSDVNKNLVKDLSNLTAKMKPVAAKMQAARDDYTQYDANVSNQWRTLTNELSSVVRDWQSDVQKLTEEGELKNQLNDLSKYLYNRSIGRE